MSSTPVIFFDGYCNLCNWAVKLILEKDKYQVFRLASLQSEYAQRNLPRIIEIPEQPESVLYFANEKLLSESDALLAIVGDLPGVWKYLKILKIIPKFIRDALYQIVAKNRYRWFGKQQSCLLPSPDIADRFF